METFLNTHIKPLQQILSEFVQNTHTYTNPTSLLGAWLSSDTSSHHPPTWKNFLWVIHRLKLDDLAQQEVTYLSGAIEQEDQHSVDSGMSEAEYESENETDIECEG